MSFVKLMLSACCLVVPMVARLDHSVGQAAETRKRDAGSNVGKPNIGTSDSDSTTPNIIFILFDDMGYSDFSAHGSEYSTPNIDSLYSESIVLNYHYIGLVCSPTRSQIISGRFAWNYAYSLQKAFNTGTLASLPTAVPTIGNLLQDYTNYNTYYTGKWHLGVAADEHLPLNRGFKQFHGYYTSGIDYETKILKQHNWDEDIYDWRANEDVDYDTANTFSTYVTESKIEQLISDNIELNDKNNEDNPFFIIAGFQAPHTPLTSLVDYGYDCSTDEYAMVNEYRQAFCENMRMIDDVMGDMVDYLKDNDLWDNTMIVFTSDNGGAGRSTQGSCNYPLRGSKGELFEGGIRTATFIGGGYVPENQRGTERNEFMHVVDWIPTLLTIAGADVDTISDDLQNILYEPIAEALSLSTYGTTDNKDEFLSSVSFDGYDLSQWLLYGDSNDNQRKEVPLSMNNYVGQTATFRNNINDKSLRKTKRLPRSGEDFETGTGSGTSLTHLEEDIPNGDIGIIFTSSITGKTYKFMYLEDIPVNIVKRTYCQYTESMLFRIDLLNGRSKIDVNSDHSINGKNDDLKMMCEDEQRLNFTSNKLLFDFYGDPTEEINLLDALEDDDGFINYMSMSNSKRESMSSMNPNLRFKAKTNELIQVYNEALDLVDNYLDSVFMNDWMGCIMTPFYNESDPANFGSDAISSWWDFDEYVVNLEKYCDGELGDNTKILYTTVWNDYKTAYEEKMNKIKELNNNNNSLMSIFNTQHMHSYVPFVVLCVFVFACVYYLFGKKFNQKKVVNEYTPLKNQNIIESL